MRVLVYHHRYRGRAWWRFTLSDRTQIIDSDVTFTDLLLLLEQVVYLLRRMDVGEYEISVKDINHDNL